MNLILVSDSLPFSRLIQWAQTRRYSKDASQWNHVALEDSLQTVYEATPRGVGTRTTEGYPGSTVEVIKLEMLPADEAQAAAFLYSQFGTLFNDPTNQMTRAMVAK